MGVLGGGQLGRMFVHAAQSMGFGVVVLEPDGHAPAARVADTKLLAPYDDEASLAELSRLCAAVTTEFENVPAASLHRLAAHCSTAPEAAAVEVCQHRLREKAQFAAAGVPCAAHAALRTEADLAGIPPSLFPGILKTARMGYDGKGQRPVDDAAALAGAWNDLGRAECVLEARLAIRCELSVIVARGADGHCVHLPVQQNLHRGGILAVTRVPAPDADAATIASAVAMAHRLAEAMDYVGVLCVELFILDDGQLVANEMAPRPHNSGHYSIDACDVSQFELQVRTLAGWPLVAPRQHSAAVMLNLLGDLWFTGGLEKPSEPEWAPLLELPGVHLHLYGKAEARRGRKMGHLTVTAVSAGQACRVALQCAERLGIERF